ncbi:MAG: hypothetical protein GX685_03045 [Clostridiales bacterium]|jgi:hypothetical protein|nr:hypothetical protein [Clostridiales bacterium]
MGNELDSTLGIPDDELTERFIKAVELENERKKIKKVPIAKYDHETGKPYLEYPDGRREYA